MGDFSLCRERENSRYLDTVSRLQIQSQDGVECTGALPTSNTVEYKLGGLTVWETGESAKCSEGGFGNNEVKAMGSIKHNKHNIT